MGHRVLRAILFIPNDHKHGKAHNLNYVNDSSLT